MGKKLPKAKALHMMPFRRNNAFEFSSTLQEASSECREMTGSRNRLEGNLGNRPRNPASGPAILFPDGCSETRDPHVRYKWSLKALLRRCKIAVQSLADGQETKVTTKDIAILVTLAVLLMISIALNVYLAVKRHRLQAALSHSCPQGWARSGGRCYYFSATKEAWDIGQDHCVSHGGSLVAMDTPQERDFVMSSEGFAAYWIGLRREGVQQPWKQPDGSLFSNWFPIGGNGLCAYLNDKEVNSTQCINSRRWICSKLVTIPQGL